MEVILNINDLKYENLWNTISLSIEKGKLTTLAGSNNCGKTTLSRILDRKISGNFNINLKGKDIQDYSLEEYDHLVQVVYPLEAHFHENKVEEELERISKDKMSFFKEQGLIPNFFSKEIKKLSTQEIIWLQLLIAISKAEELIVLDGIDKYLSNQELEYVYLFIKECIRKYKQAFFMMTTSLESTIYSDKLYILKDKEVALHGEPLTILQKDNIINKAGLNVPFMIDLSVKLRDYDLVKDIQLTKEGLIDILWK